MSAGEIIGLSVLAVVAAAALCWSAVRVALHRVRRHEGPAGHHERSGRL